MKGVSRVLDVMRAARKLIDEGRTDVHEFGKTPFKSGRV